MITQGLEDYLELIYNSITEGNNIKAVDISNKFNISRSSVSEALIRLAGSDLIIYEGRKGIKITEKGKAEAQKIIKKHKILLEFFTNVLNIDFEEANKNACRIEHVIDDSVVNQIKRFGEFCKAQHIHSKFKEL